MNNLFSDVEIKSVLHEGRQGYLAVEGRSGPHLTPQLYAVAGGDLVSFAAAGTMKVKIAKRRPQAAMLVRGGPRSVSVTGTLEIVDPASVRDLLRPGRALNSARDAATFAVRNASDLIGFGRDTLLGRAGKFPPSRRVLLRLRPKAVALLDGGAVTANTGSWPGSRDQAKPDESERTPAGWDSAVVTLDSPAGLLAAPGLWDESTGRAVVPRSIVGLAGGFEGGPASVVLDEYVSPGPAPKEGRLIVGTASVEDNEATSWMTLRIEANRTAEWDGVDTSSQAHE